MHELKIKYVGTEPTQAHKGDAGYDLRASLPDGPLTIGPGEIRMVDLDFRCDIPEGYVGLEFPRSGLGTRGITLANCVGVIDSGYRGPVKAGLINLSGKDFTVEDGFRVCQLVLVRHASVDWVPADGLGTSERGENGYGSTGLR